MPFNCSHGWPVVLVKINAWPSGFMVVRSKRRYILYGSFLCENTLFLCCKIQRCSPIIALSRYIHPPLSTREQGVYLIIHINFSDAYGWQICHGWRAITSTFNDQRSSITKGTSVHILFWLIPRKYYCAAWHRQREADRQSNYLLIYKWKGFWFIWNLKATMILFYLIFESGTDSGRGFTNDWRKCSACSIGISSKTTDGSKVDNILCKAASIAFIENKDSGAIKYDI